MHQQVYHSPVYLSQSIQAWEQRWFAKQNSSYALMQQVAWMISQRLVPILKQRQIQNIRAVGVPSSFQRSALF